MELNLFQSRRSPQSEKIEKKKVAHSSPDMVAHFSTGENGYFLTDADREAPFHCLNTFSGMRMGKGSPENGITPTMGCW
jgi:hypothetical protein